MARNYRAELTGVFGDPVDGNPTGVMEEAAFDALGLNFRYLTMRVLPEDLAAAFAGAKAVGMRGVNLTMPHKIKILPLLDRLSEAAALIGAVNTVYRDGPAWVGENTDGKGFVRALALEGLSPAGKRITILGAGGAARAIAVECALAGAASVAVVNRSRERGEELAALIDSRTGAAARYLPWTERFPVPGETDILIQATSIGLFPDVKALPNLDYETIRPDLVACDVVFNPVRSRFLNEAAARGARTVTGIGMLVQQGALNFELWTGEQAPVEVMYRTLAREFETNE